MECAKVIMKNIFQDHFEDIMFTLMQVAGKEGLKATDMIIELDLVPGANGIIPALQDRIDFKIAPIRDYLDGSEKPSWLSRGENIEMAEAIADRTKVVAGNLKSDQCLVMARYAMGMQLLPINIGGYQDILDDSWEKFKRCAAGYQGHGGRV